MDAVLTAVGSLAQLDLATQLDVLLVAFVLGGWTFAVTAFR
jgi:hypothetical protein